MPLFNPLHDAPNLTPADRLDALREALDLLGRRLRADIASALARTMAEVVRDALLDLLATPGPPRQPARRHPERRSSPWDDPDEEDRSPYLWGDPGDDPHESGYARRPDWDHSYAVPEPTPAPTPHRRRPWLSALAAGWQATRWWLARRPGR